jgi:hypothetical protein
MVEDIDPIQVRTRAASNVAQLLFVSEDGDLRYPITGADRGGLDRPWIITLWQDYVLEVSGGALTDTL